MHFKEIEVGEFGIQLTKIIVGIRMENPSPVTGSQSLSTNSSSS